MHSRLDIALAVTGEGTRAAPSISSWVKQEGDQVKFRTLLRLFSFFLFFFSTAVDLFRRNTAFLVNRKQ